MLVFNYAGKSMIFLAFCGAMGSIKSHILTIKENTFIILLKFEDSNEKSCRNQK